MELESDDVAEGVAVGRVAAQQGNKHGRRLPRATLKRLEDDVEHSVWIEVEAACAARVTWSVTYSRDLVWETYSTN